MTRAPIGHHGPTHMIDGEDPVPGIGGLQYGGDDPVYGPENVGAWLHVVTTGTGGPDDAGLILQNSGDGSLELDDLSGGGLSLNTYNDGGIFIEDKAAGGIFLKGDNDGGIFLNDRGGGGISLNTDDAGGIALNDPDGGSIEVTSGRLGTGGSIVLRLGSTGLGVGLPELILTTQGGGDNGILLKVSDSNSMYLDIVGLPTTNPGGSGRVWNNGGILNIT